MTLTELRYIVALAQEQHFGRAAERCHVSQPTLTIAVKKLEEELGVLFERAKQGVLLTPLGQKIVAMAARVLEKTAEIKDVAAGARTSSKGRWRSGRRQPWDRTCCRSSFRYCRRWRTGCRSMSRRAGGELAAKLRNGDLDVPGHGAVFGNRCRNPAAVR